MNKEHWTDPARSLPAVFLVIKRYKKTMAALMVTLASVTVIGAITFTFLAYRAAPVAAAKVQDLKLAVSQKISETQLAQADLTVFENVVLQLASTWLHAGLADPQIARLQRGLTCIDALGGPSPSEAVSYLRGKVQDQKTATQLDQLGENLKNNTAAPGTSACVNWLLNS
jgi:hypothetical protein